MGKQKSRRREASIGRHERTQWRGVQAERKLHARKHERGAHDSEPMLGCEACLNNMPFSQLRRLVKGGN